MLCEDCGGRGMDPGALGPGYRAGCPSCHGSGEEPDLLEGLSLEERIVASIAVIRYRRGKEAA